MLRKSILLVSCLFVLAMAIIGCSGGGGGNPVAPTALTSETAGLSGTVLFDNTPLANASVYLYKSEKAHIIGMAQLPSLRGSLAAQQIISDGAYTTTTNADGVYNFVDIPVGQYTLIALRDENHQFVQTGVLLGAVTTLNPKLTPTGKIAGKVTQTIGGITQNISGAFVYITGTCYIALTNASGTFVINNVPANSTSTTPYEVQVMHALGNATAKTGITVSPGETANIGTFALVAPTTAYQTLSGSLIARNGVNSAELGGTFIMLTRQEDGSLLGTNADIDGKYLFSVTRPGNYAIMAVNTDYVFDPATVRVEITNLSNGITTVTGINVDAAMVQNTGSITGLVSLAGAPVAGAVVHASGTSLLGVSNAAGKFVIDKVPANTSATPYNLEVSSNIGTAPAKTGVVVNIGQTTDAGTFAITVPTAGYKTIVGTLTAVLPVTSTQMANRLLQLTAPDGKVIAAFSKANGSFSFMATQIGNHSVTVMDTEFAYAPRTQSINVAALNNATQALSQINVSSLNNTGTISGQVTHLGSPVAGAVVNVVGTSLTGVSASSGNYVIERVPASIPHSVEVSSKVGTAAPVTGITVSAGAVTTLNFALTVPPAYKTVTGLLSPQAPVTTAQLGNRLVHLAMPDGKVIAAYSDSAGAFSFMVTQAGLSTVTVIDKDLVYDPRTQSVNVTALDNGSVSQTITSISASEIVVDSKVSVDGMINKLIKIRPETNNGGVNVKLTPETPTPALYALSNPDGSFRFMVEPGTYTLTVEGSYQLDSPSPVIINVSSPYAFATNINVRPVQPVSSIVEGLVTWGAPPGGWALTDGEVILENKAGTPAFSERRSASALTGFFRFDSVPPGSYTATIGHTNGYSGQTSVEVHEGQDLTVANTFAVNISATFYAPFITSTTVSGNTLAILGSNFELNASMLQAIVNGIALPATGTWVTGECYFNVSSLAPGQHSVQLIRSSDTYGNKSTFIREVQPPLLANFTASSTDTSITCTWQNAPYINEVEIRLIKFIDSTVVRPAQRIIGNSFTYDKLLPNATYTIEVSSTYPNVANSAPTAFNFATKTDGASNISSLAFLPGAGTIATGTIFGFEVVNGIAYIGFDNSGPITIQAFNLSSNVLMYTSTPVNTNSSQPRRSLAANSTGVYLTYANTSASPTIAVFGPTLGAPTLTEDLVTKFSLTPAPDMATVRSLNDRIFLVVAEGSYPITTSLFELDSSLNPIQTATPVSGNTNPYGKMADIAYDRITSTIYLACPNPTNDVSVMAFSNMNITTAPTYIGNIASSDKQVLGFYANNKKVYLSQAAFSSPSYYPSASVMDTSSGYAKLITSSYPGSFGFDRQNRIWAGSLGFDIKYLLQLDNAMNILETLKIFNTDFIALNLPMARLDDSTGIMYMLHFNASNALAVYRYNSNY